MRGGRALTAVLAAAVAIGASPAVAAPAVVVSGPATDPAPQDAETLYIRALEAKDGGSIEDAAALFGQAYGALPPAKQVTETGMEWVVDEAHALYIEAYSNDARVEHLRADQALLTAFVDALRAAAGGASTVDAAKAEAALAVVADLIAQHERQPTPVPNVDGEAGAIAVAPTPSDRPAPPPAAPQGKGLVAGGSVLMVAGLVVTVFGGARVEWAEGQLNADASPEDNAAYINRAQLTQKVMLGIGIPAAIVGAGLVAWGAVRLTRTSAPTARVRVTGGPTLAGVGAALSF